MQYWIMGPKVEGNLSDKPLTVYFIFSKLNNNIWSLNQREALGGLDNFLSRNNPPTSQHRCKCSNSELFSEKHKKTFILFLTEWNLSGTPENNPSQQWAFVLHVISVADENVRMEDQYSVNQDQK